MAFTVYEKGFEGNGYIIILKLNSFLHVILLQLIFNNLKRLLLFKGLKEKIVSKLQYALEDFMISD